MTKETITEYPVTVDYEMPLEKVFRLGRYSFIDPRISEVNFPTGKKGRFELTLELLHFGRYFSTSQVLGEFIRLERQSGDLRELLAFGIKYPDVLQKFPVAVLASIWLPPNDCRCVIPVSMSIHKKRPWLFLVGFGDEWPKMWRFLVVRRPELITKPSG